jgi:hypothetical protein
MKTAFSETKLGARETVRERQSRTSHRFEIFARLDGATRDFEICENSGVLLSPWNQGVFPEGAGPASATIATILWVPTILILPCKGLIQKWFRLISVDSDAIFARSLTRF